MGGLARGTSALDGSRPPFSREDSAPVSAQEVCDRSDFVGCSDLAPLLGFPRFGMDRWKLWALKRKLIEPEPGTRLTRWGHRLEDVVADAFTERTGRRLRRQNKRATHPKLPFFSAQIDRRVVGERALCEIKTVDTFNAREWGDEGSDQIPVHYMPQVQGQLGLTQLELVRRWAQPEELERKAEQERK